MNIFICNATKSIYFCIYVFIHISWCWFSFFCALQFSLLRSYCTLWVCFVFAIVFFSLFTSRRLSSSPICFKKFIFLALLSVFGLKFHICAHFFFCFVTLLFSLHTHNSLNKYDAQHTHMYLYRDKRKRSQGSYRRDINFGFVKTNETHADWNLISINNRISTSIHWHTPILYFSLLVLSRTRAAMIFIAFELNAHTIWILQTLQTHTQHLTKIDIDLLKNFNKIVCSKSQFAIFKWLSWS